LGSTRARNEHALFVVAAQSGKFLPRDFKTVQFGVAEIAAGNPTRRGTSRQTSLTSKAASLRNATGADHDRRSPGDRR
jgi:hypothetical protein